jgi:ribosomal protein S27E
VIEVNENITILKIDPKEKIAYVEVLCYECDVVSRIFIDIKASLVECPICGTKYRITPPIFS